MFHAGQDVALGLSVNQLRFVKNFSFLQYFHGVDVVLLPQFAYQYHFAEATLSEEFEHLKIFESDAVPDFRWALMYF